MSQFKILSILSFVLAGSAFAQAAEAPKHSYAWDFRGPVFCREYVDGIAAQPANEALCGAAYFQWLESQECHGYSGKGKDLGLYSEAFCGVHYFFRNGTCGAYAKDGTYLGPADDVNNCSNH